MVPVRDLEQALERANELPFGLAGHGFTASARNVEVGVKESGDGREGGVEGLYAYTTVKSVSHLVR